MTAPERPVVAINTLAVNPSNAGSRTMVTEMVHALAQAAPDFRLLLICHPGNRELFDPDLDAIVIDRGLHKLPRRIAYDLWNIPRLVRDRADVLVTPSNIAPLYCPIPQVAVIGAHLVLPSCQEASLPERMPWLKIQYFKWPFRRYLKQATRVLGISQFLADGVVEELGIDEAKVRAMPLGVHPPAAGPTRDGRDDTVLFVGTLYRYKGGETAVRAFAAARPQLPATARLVFVGRDKNDEAARLAALAEECGVGDAVEIRGPVDDEELEARFRSSGVLLMPSICEGYGLPVAEAMAYGLPVIAAAATALPDVAGDAAILVEPRDVEGYARALIDVLTDDDRRRSMTERGIERATELGWEQTGVALRAAIEESLAAAPA